MLGTYCVLNRLSLKDLSICCVDEIIEFKIHGVEDQNNFI